MEAQSTEQNNSQHGFMTKAWAGLCHNCEICQFAHKKQGSNFEKVMRWHRTWCPGWNSHTKVYGLKNLEV